MRRKILIGLSLFYAAMMVYLLFLQRLDVLFRPPLAPYWEWVRQSVSLMPLQTIRYQLALIEMGRNPYLVRFAVGNLVGNVVMFIPLGFFLPCLFRRQRRFRTLFVSVTAIVLVVETLQALTHLGAADIDDLLLNVPGALLGYGVFRFPPVNRMLERRGYLN